MIETIGRLKEKYPSISQYYSTTVTKDPDSDNAIDITWSEKKTLDNKSAINGIYCLRTNNQTMDEKTLWKTYTTLTDLESVFKSLKSELGLRPIFHQTQTRVDGHLFITLLAYSIIHTIRYKLKQKGIHYSWDTIRHILRNQKRITTSMKCKDGSTLYIRQSSELNEKQKEIYDALEIKYGAGDVTKTFIE
ncbi:MAG: transposase [Sulfurimonas sp.]|nr:transposase [Sulfurimonas sp.]MDQ7062085.1 transposase [Sulfurimonas sp.]